MNRARVAAVLAFVAAALAAAGVVVLYLRKHQLDIAMVGATLFLVAVGFYALKREATAGTAAPREPR